MTTQPDAAKPRRRFREFLGNLLLFSVTVVLTLGVGELVVRWLRPQQTKHSAPLYQAADTVGWEHLPNVKERSNTGERWNTIVTDSQGFRVGTSGRVEADTKVLVMGDSFMEGLAVSYEETVAGRLQAALPEALGRPVAVRNGGVSGYSPSQYFMATERAFRHERFGAVVVSLFVGNDLLEKRVLAYRRFDRRSQPTPSWPRQWTFREANTSIVLPIMLRVVNVSHLARLVWNSTELLRARLGLSEWAFPSAALKSAAKGPIWSIAADICADIAKATANQGGSTLFVIVPDFAQMDSTIITAEAKAFGIDPADVDIDQPNRLLEATLHERGLDVIDATDELRAANRAGKAPYGAVDHHFSPEGHAIFARLAEPWLVKQLGGSTPPATPSSPAASGRPVEPARTHRPRP